MCVEEEKEEEEEEDDDDDEKKGMGEMGEGGREREEEKYISKKKKKNLLGQRTGGRWFLYSSGSSVRIVNISQKNFESWRLFPLSLARHSTLSGFFFLQEHDTENYK